MSSTVGTGIGSDRAAALRTLLLDASAARAQRALGAQGVPSVLLKGRAIANWLYPKEVRHYRDVDLLVAWECRDRAVEVLATLGYRHWLEGAAESEYGTNEIELVGPDGVCIDLHHTLIGVTGPAQRCWEVLSARTTTMIVGGSEVTVLDIAPRTMHLALHAAQNGVADVKAICDLKRGLAAMPVEVWREAASIATAIDAQRAFATGLRLVEEGVAMADALELRDQPDIGLLLRTSSAPAEALMIQRFVETGSTRARARLILRKLWPTTAYMAVRVPISRYPVPTLVVARLRRLAGLPTRFRVALRSWQDARRIVHEQTVDNRTYLGTIEKDYS